MYSPPLHITLYIDSTSRKPTPIIRAANWMFEKTAISGRVMAGGFRSGPRDPVINVAQPQTLKKAKHHDKFVAHINKLVRIKKENAEANRRSIQKICFRICPMLLESGLKIKVEFDF